MERNVCKISVVKLVKVVVIWRIDLSVGCIIIKSYCERWPAYVFLWIALLYLFIYLEHFLKIKKKNHSSMLTFRV